MEDLEVKEAPPAMRKRVLTIAEILKGSEYALTLFSAEEVAALELFDRNGKTYLMCAVTSKPRPAKPEEIVRQLYLRKLMDEYGYLSERIAIEKQVYFGSSVHEKAADIVVWEKGTKDTPYIIVECKKPKRKDGLEQLKSYCNAEGSPIGVWTNGGETIYLHREDPNLFRNLDGIPRADQTLAEMLNQPWTLEDLEKENILVEERTSLKDIILDMEDLVLANAGVDAFEEVFKLIYAKLYDEARAARSPKGKRNLAFRVGGRTPREFAEVVDDLFAKACEEWPGVFQSGERVGLEPDHLKVCGSALERVKLFNSNLSVIDEAFEYLSIKAGKGEKGQYFTPRHVIDMCVRMLNPDSEEYVVDTAAGSCGFTVHSIFHVWGDVFTAKGPNQWQAQYAGTHVYGIDFDPRSVKIAKALNTIAGDGKTNVYRANTLDTKMWSEEARAGLRPRLRHFKNAAEDQENQKTFRYFDFDVLLTNPPFAGDIKDNRILSQYDLARSQTGKWEKAVGRDILFIEHLRSNMASNARNVMACGASSLSFESGLRLVELMRKLNIESVPATSILAVVQVLPEMDSIYTPVMKRGQSETVRIGQVDQRYGYGTTQSLQRYAADQIQFLCRCKRAAVIWDWINGVSIDELERRFTTNPFQGVVGYGDIMRIAEGTRFHLRSAHQILAVLFPSKPDFLEQLDEILLRLELGLPADALPLANDLSSSLSRGQYLALFAAGCQSAVDVKTLTSSQLIDCIGLFGAKRLRPEIDDPKLSQP